MSEHTTTRDAGAFDPALLAGEARSILACPGDAELAVDGEPEAAAASEDLDLDGTGPEPLFRCRPDAWLALAAGCQRGAVLEVTSGLGAPGAPGHRPALTVVGHLETRGREHCPCCVEQREVVALVPDLVLLERPPAGPPGWRLPLPKLRVPLAAFRADEHLLNRGYLHRSTRHANDCHQDDLRRAAARLAGRPLMEIGGAGIGALTRTGLRLQWLDREGAHEADLAFGHHARTAEDLGDLIRSALGEPVC
jgi:hypothetical protein